VFLKKLADKTMSESAERKRDAPLKTVVARHQRVPRGARATVYRIQRHD
jgi:hypothetical protein